MSLDPEQVRTLTTGAFTLGAVALGALLSFFSIGAQRHWTKQDRWLEARKKAHADFVAACTHCRHASMAERNRPQDLARSQAVRDALIQVHNALVQVQLVGTQRTYSAAIPFADIATRLHQAGSDEEAARLDREWSVEQVKYVEVVRSELNTRS